MLFTPATPDDEGEIRRLLRENPLGGRVPLSLEREPDGWASPHLAGERRCFIMAREDAQGPAIGLCERVVRRAFFDGEERWLPYLGALRVAASHRRRIAVLKGGFAALRNAERPDECRFALTSITEDNIPARRLLTAGLAGLPTYRPAGGFSTLVLRPRRTAIASGVAIAGDGRMDEVANFLGQQSRQRQFAPCWTAHDLRNLEGATFLVAEHRGAIVGCVSVWDQRAFRQTVVHDYPSIIRYARPAINLAGRLLGLPALPRPGTVLPQAFVSHLAAQESDVGIMQALVAAALDVAAQRGFSAAIVGVPTKHAWRGALKRSSRSVEYRTMLYTVQWEGDVEPVNTSSDRPAFPEIGLL